MGVSLSPEDARGWALVEGLGFRGLGVLGFRALGVYGFRLPGADFWARLALQGFRGVM